MDQNDSQSKNSSGIVSLRWSMQLGQRAWSRFSENGFFWKIVAPLFCKTHGWKSGYLLLTTCVFHSFLSTTLGLNSIKMFFAQ